MLDYLNARNVVLGLIAEAVEEEGAEVSQIIFFLMNWCYINMTIFLLNLLKNLIKIHDII